MILNQQIEDQHGAEDIEDDAPQAAGVDVEQLA
jgi:hypothetical protein